MTEEINTKSETLVDYGYQSSDRGIIKRYIPYFIYKPPFGYPRTDIDYINVRKLAATPYFWSVENTLLDEISAIDWDIVPNKNIKEEKVIGKIKKIKDFLYNPNDNDESLRSIIRAVARDVIELDAGVMNKVYNKKDELTQLYTIDGATILKNPDIHGYMGNKLDYVKPEYVRMTPIETEYYYNAVLKNDAAYFQYTWTGGMYPVPFGKKEIVYIMKNDRSDSIYGYSPVMVLYDILLTLLYSSKVNLDMYIHNNLPLGIVSILNANAEQIKGLREKLDTTILETDAFQNTRTKFFKPPIVNTEIDYIPFNIDPQKMQMLEQQKWYQQLVWALLGVTPTEMGYIDDANRSNSVEQSKVFKRKALKPILKLLEYHINTQIVWELDTDREVIFEFDNYDIDEDYKKQELYEKKIANYMTINEIRTIEELPPLQDERYDQVGKDNYFNNFSLSKTKETELNQDTNKPLNEQKSEDEKIPGNTQLKTSDYYTKLDAMEKQDLPIKKNNLDELGLPTEIEKQFINFYKNIQDKTINYLKRGV